MDDLALVVSLIALDDILGRHSALGKINVALLFVHSEHDDDLVPSDTDELLDTSNTSSGELRKQNHAVAGSMLVEAALCI